MIIVPHCLFICLRLGVRPSDLDRFNIPQQCRLPMTEEDIKTGKVREASFRFIIYLLDYLPFIIVCLSPDRSSSRRTLSRRTLSGLPNWSLCSRRKRRRRFRRSARENEVKCHLLSLFRICHVHDPALSHPHRFGFQYLSQVYLPLKLQEGDWI